MSAGTALSREARQDKIRQVNRASVWVDGALSLGKTLGGWMTGSQALLVDGIHSLSDLMTDLFVEWLNHLSHEDPDDEHPYGHARFETAGTIVFALFLLAVATGFAWQAAGQLLSEDAIAPPTVEALWIAVIALITKEWLYQYTHRWGKQLSAPLLVANAWHHRSDVLSTIVVILGVVGALAGYPLADALAAVVVALMIAAVGLKLAWQALVELVDTAPYSGRARTLKRAIIKVPGVKSVHALRSRKMGPHTFLDVHIEVPSTISVSEGHSIGDRVVQTLKATFPDIQDVTVHVDAENDETRPSTPVALPSRETVATALRAAWRDLPCFDQVRGASLHYLDGKIHADVLLPLDCLTRSELSAEALEDLYRKGASDLAWMGQVHVLFVTREATQLADALDLSDA